MVQFTVVSTPHFVYALRMPGDDGAPSTDGEFVTSHEGGKEVIYAFVRHEHAQTWAESQQATLGFLLVPEQIHLRDLRPEITLARCFHPDGRTVDIPLPFRRETPYQTVRREFEERNR